MAEEEKKVNNTSNNTSAPKKTSRTSSASSSAPTKTSRTSSASSSTSNKTSSSKTSSSSTSTPRKTSTTSSSTPKAKTAEPKTTNLNSTKKTSTTAQPKSASSLNVSKETLPKTSTKTSATSAQTAKPTTTPVVNKKPGVKEINAKNLDSNIIAEDKEDGKKKKKKFLIIFFIILGILAAVAVGVVLLTSIKTTEIDFSVSLEAEIKTEIVDSDNNVIGHIKYMPGDLVDAKLKIKVQNEEGTYTNDKSVFLRFKIDIFVDDNYVTGLFNPIFSKDGDWTIGDDGYYYYNFRCYGNDDLTIFEHLEIIGSANNNVLNGKTGKLVFTAEILEGNFSAISQSWHTSPDEWRTQSSLRG